MTTMAMNTHTLEELVDRLLAALLGEGLEPSPSLVKAAHEARRLRQSGDPDGALAMLADVDAASTTEGQLRWLYAEWLDIARRRFAGTHATLYSPATGRAAVLLERDDGSLETAAVLGVRWPVGKLVSRRSLRGLKPLAKGGAAWS